VDLNLRKLKKITKEGDASTLLNSVPENIHGTSTPNKSSVSRKHENTQEKNPAEIKEAAEKERKSTRDEELSGRKKEERDDEAERRTGTRTESSSRQIEKQKSDIVTPPTDGEKQVVEPRRRTKLSELASTQAEIFHPRMGRDGGGGEIGEDWKAKPKATEDGRERAKSDGLTTVGATGADGKWIKHKERQTTGCEGGRLKTQWPMEEPQSNWRQHKSSRTRSMDHDKDGPSKKEEHEAKQLRRPKITTKPADLTRQARKERHHTFNL
jgi:hypothetical protein